MTVAHVGVKRSAWPDEGAVRRSALITGASGFVGGHLAERLVAEGWRVRALVRPTSDVALLERLGAELVTGDLADAEAVRRAVAGVDLVFHLAGVTAARDPASYVRTNVEGTRHLCAALASAAPGPARIVHLSSYAACGPARAGRARSADEPPAPLTAYGRTKLAGEALVRRLEGAGVDVVVLRAPAVYGPRDRALLPYFRLVQWRLAPMPAGERRLHVIFAPDLARALLRATLVGSGTYAVAEPAEHSWGDIVAAIGQSLRRRPVRVPLPPAVVRGAAAATQALGATVGKTVLFNRDKAEEMLAPSWTCDLRGCAALLGPEGATPLRAGIARTAEWYRSRGWLS